MRIAVVSDTHSNLKNVDLLVRALEREPVDALLHCGDICCPETIRCLSGRPTHFVLGNNDFDVAGLRWAALEIGGQVHGRFADLKLAGKRIALLHGDDLRLLKSATESALYDFVFFGHSHRVERNQIGRTLVYNPGAVHRARPKTFARVDLSAATVEIVKLAE